MRRPGGRLAWLLAVALVAGGARPAPSEREVEAAFLCSFAEFVDWPDARPEEPVTILVLGEDPFGALLDETAAARPLQTRRIEIRRSRRHEDSRRARVVFVSDSEEPRLAEILRRLGDLPVLTVSDIPDFAERGGVIGFVLEGRRVRFAINLGTAERARLRISSRLLNLARLVETPAGRRDATR